MESFKVMPGVIIFFHFRNGSVSHLTWNTEANGEKLPWHEKEGNFSSHEIIVIGNILENEQDCLHFMLLLADMHGYSSFNIKEVPLASRRPKEDGHGIIAFQFA